MGDNTMPQYADFRKKHETVLSVEEIKKDKLALENALMTKVSISKSAIIDRLYEINDIGVIECTDKEEVNSIKEAENLYALKCYKGCIAICGLIAESLCKKIECQNNIHKSSDQCSRINNLYSLGLKSDSVKQSLHTIRLSRNNCIHFNNSFALSDDCARQKMALKSINLLKSVFSDIYNHPSSIEQIIANEIESNKDTNQDELAIIYKNAMNRIGKSDITINSHQIIAKTIVAKILEIDIDSSIFKEITVMDLSTPWCPFVIDLTYAQADEIKNKKIQENQLVLITIISKVSSNGITETWHLINLDEILA